MSKMSQQNAFKDFVPEMSDIHNRAGRSPVAISCLSLEERGYLDEKDHNEKTEKVHDGVINEGNLKSRGKITMTKIPHLLTPGSRNSNEILSIKLDKS